MLWAYLWATHWADEFDKPCAAYAVDAGQIKSGLNRRLARSQASETDLIITRSAAAGLRGCDAGRYGAHRSHGRQRLHICPRP